MRTINLFWGLVASLCLLLQACSSGSSWKGENPFKTAQAVKAQSWAQSHSQALLRLGFSSNVNGEVDVCGCAVDPKGGLDRRLNWVRQASKGGPMLLVDAGNAFFPTADLDPSQVNRAKARAKAVLRAHALMGLQAQNVGYLDLAAGADFLRAEAKAAKLQLLSATWLGADGKALFTPQHRVKVGGVDVLLVGLSNGGAGKAAAALGVKDPLEALREETRGVGDEVLVVVLSDLGRSKEQELARSINRPLVFVGARDVGSLETPVHEGAALHVQPQIKGQQWGTVDLAWNPRGRAWYNAAMGARFSQRWDELQLDQESLARSAASVERDAELRKVADVREKLLEYAPGNLSEKVVYEYRLVNMSEDWAKKANELTPIVKKLR